MTATSEAQNGADSITWLGHASFLVRLAGKTIITDPYLTDYASPFVGNGPKRFVPAAVAIEKLPPIDALVLSHNHYDHLDTRSIDILAGKEHMTVIVPLGLGRYFSARGYADVREVDWHDRVDIGGVTVTALPAIHFSRRTLFDRNKTLWMGALIESNKNRVFFSGDTAYGPVFKEVGDRYGPIDYGIIGIGAYLPRKIMQASHTTPEEAVMLARDIEAKTLIGMHWGTVVLTDEPAFEPPVRFEAAARTAGYAPEQTWIMKIGETRPLGGAWPSN
jgi:L-ascorbate metabolism protein UlaG (beta-lactamase superfamily)